MEKLITSHAKHMTRGATLKVNFENTLTKRITHVIRFSMKINSNLDGMGYIIAIQCNQGGLVVHIESLGGNCNLDKRLGWNVTL